MKRFQILLSLALLLYWTEVARAQSHSPVDSIRVTKIWDKAEHNAFTDLVHFKGNFYCVFREAASHVGGPNSGTIRVLKSKDGHQWAPTALLTLDGLDLRDAKLSVTPKNRLMVVMAGAAFSDGVVQELYPFVSISDALGRTFSKPEKIILDSAITPTKDWLWRVTWHKGVGYGIDYQLKENGKNRSLLKKDAWLVYLLKTTDGVHYEKITQLAIEDLPNEATVRFDKNDRLYAMVRREAGDKLGVLAESAFPYQNWTYHKLTFRLGGPNFLFMNDNRLIMGSRLFEGQSTFTALFITDLTGKVIKTIKLPSGGDTSYPGMILHQRKLWVSYYSSHEGKSAIYLAEVPLQQLSD